MSEVGETPEDMLAELDDTGSADNSGHRNRFSRRVFLKRFGAGVVAAGTAVAVKNGGLRKMINFAGGLPPHGREIEPSVHEYPRMSRESSDQLFKDLNPQRFNDEVLNPDVFYRHMDWMSSLAIRYFDGSPQSGEAFDEHMHKFVTNLDTTAQKLGFGLPQVLLGFRSSSHNIGGVRYNQDVYDEAQIYLFNKVNNVVRSGESEDSEERNLVSTWKTLDALENKFTDKVTFKTHHIPRVIGFRTFGIHDARSYDVMNALFHCGEDNEWFKDQLVQYDIHDEMHTLHTAFEHLNQFKSNAGDVINSYLDDPPPALSGLARLFNSSNFIRSMITDPENPQKISPWQLTRTTDAWAHLSINEINGVDSIHDKENTKSIEQVIEDYTSEEAVSSNAFIKAQLTNPQVRAFLHTEMVNQNRSSIECEALKHLLKTSTNIRDASAICISANKSLDKRFVGLEFDEQFQVLSGVALVKHRYDVGAPNLSFEYASDDVSLGELTMAHLQYGAYRDIGPPLLLATKPFITRADTPKLLPDMVNPRFHNIYENYKQETGKDPQEDPHALLRYLRKGFEDPTRIVTVNGHTTRTVPHKEIKELWTGATMDTALSDFELIYNMGFRR